MISTIRDGDPANYWATPRGAIIVRCGLCPVKVKIVEAQINLDIELILDTHRLSCLTRMVLPFDSRTYIWVFTKVVCFI
jgi:hypothetical protein